MNRLITILFLGITTITMQAKTDKEQIEPLYRDMYEATSSGRRGATIN